MTCREFQDRMHDFLDERIRAAERRAADAHLESCRSCRELVELSKLGMPATGQVDVVESVLEQTSGPACDRAREILCDHLDGVLAPLDDELLERHLGHCSGCAQLVTALRRLDEDLPAMAELTPPAGFLEGVMAATPTRRRRWKALAARLAQGWEALLARPRFAWEAGYVGAVAVWLVVGVSGAPFQASTALPPTDAPARVVKDVGHRVTAFGERAWLATAGRGIEAWHGLRSDLMVRYRRSETVIGDMRASGDRLKHATIELDFAESGKALKQLTYDAHSAWKKFAIDPEQAEGADTP